MSLTTLTFGSKKTGFVTQNAFVSTPSSRASQTMGKTPLTTGKIVVKKACRFYSHDNIFVVGEVADGYIAENMKGTFNDREIQIVDVESKYGHNAKKGMAIGIFLSGVDETELAEGTELDFRVL
ncbi:MAG TPA: hypothetical protein VJH23_05890 [archaeon]|nr:hypothetical protein [archaeon]